MSAQTVATVIQMIIAPVVMVTACAIIISGLLSRYSAINDRMRLMARERLDLLLAHKPELDTAPTHAYTVERLHQIDRQLPDLLRRHRLVRDAVLAVYCAIIVFIVCMFVIAIADALASAWLALGALVLFLLGTAALLVGVVLTAIEVRVSHLAIRFEVERVLSLRD